MVLLLVAERETVRLAIDDGPEARDDVLEGNETAGDVKVNVKR